MNDPTKIVRRPEIMGIHDSCIKDGSAFFVPDADRVMHLQSVVRWSQHLESRLAKYETHHPDPKPGEASIVKHTAYDPDRRPECMYKFSSYRSHPHEAGGIEDMLSGDTLELYRWAQHLESVREGLQRQLNHFDRMYQQDHDPTRRDPKSAN